MCSFQKFLEKRVKFYLKIRYKALKAPGLKSRKSTLSARQYRVSILLCREKRVFPQEV